MSRLILPRDLYLRTPSLHDLFVPGGETLSQALQRMREEGEAGAALLAEAARVFNVAPGLLAASLNSLAAEVLAPAAAELAGALEGALDVFDSLLEGLDTLPMGVGAALKLVKVVLRRAQGVQVNKRACTQLKSLVEGVGDTLARYVQRASEQQRRDLEGPLAGLTAVRVCARSCVLAHSTQV